MFVIWILFYFLPPPSSFCCILKLFFVNLFFSTTLNQTTTHNQVSVVNGRELVPLRSTDVIPKSTLKLQVWDVICFFFQEWLKNVLNCEMLCYSEQGDLKAVLTVQASGCNCSLLAQCCKRTFSSQNDKTSPETGLNVGFMIYNRHPGSLL